MKKPSNGSRRKHVSIWAERRRRDEAIRRALARPRTPGEPPVLEIGLRIEQRAGNELGDILRKSYWMAKGEKVWKQVCKNSLMSRLTSSWAGVVRRLGRG